MLLQFVYTYSLYIYMPTCYYGPFISDSMTSMHTFDFFMGIMPSGNKNYSTPFSKERTHAFMTPAGTIIILQAEVSHLKQIYSSTRFSSAHTRFGIIYPVS